MRFQINQIQIINSISKTWHLILNIRFAIQILNHNGISREACQDNPMRRFSEILLNSLVVSSAYADNFRVRSCNDDSTVSFYMALEQLSIIDTIGHRPRNIVRYNLSGSTLRMRHIRLTADIDFFIWLCSTDSVWALS